MSSGIPTITGIGIDMTSELQAVYIYHELPRKSSMAANMENNVAMEPDRQYRYTQTLCFVFVSRLRRRGFFTSGALVLLFLTGSTPGAMAAP